MAGRLDYTAQCVAKVAFAGTPFLFKGGKQLEILVGAVSQGAAHVVPTGFDC
jgi:hypothetical protein